MSIKITFHGAAGGVTGSAYLVETGRARLLIDCGLFQGVDEGKMENAIPETLDPPTIDTVLLTHAHLDHTGRLPLLWRAGFRGKLLCTSPTIDLAELILRDAVRLQAEDWARENRRRESQGKELLPSPPTVEEVIAILGKAVAIRYDEIVRIAPDVKARFRDAGHMLGSASIELFVTANGDEKTILFSGDLGAPHTPIMRDPSTFRNADLVIMESTYGDRNHRSFAETVTEFEDVVLQAIKENGKILIPSFAVGRTQLLTYLLEAFFQDRSIPRFPVFVDSPMAIEATGIYKRYVDFFDEEFHLLQKTLPRSSTLGNIRAVTSTAESKKLNNMSGPCLIIAGSGMCNGGRIIHHIRHGIESPATHIIFVGYQAQGTLGRTLVGRPEEVKISGAKLSVRATIHTINGFSAHAGQNDLLVWIAPLMTAKPRVVLTHGEDHARTTLAEAIRSRWDLTPELPLLGETITL